MKKSKYHQDIHLAAEIWWQTSMWLKFMLKTTIEFIG